MYPWNFTNCIDIKHLIYILTLLLLGIYQFIVRVVRNLQWRLSTIRLFNKILSVISMLMRIMMMIKWYLVLNDSWIMFSILHYTWKILSQINVVVAILHQICLQRHILTFRYSLVHHLVILHSCLYLKWHIDVNFMFISACLWGG